MNKLKKLIIYKILNIFNKILLNKIILTNNNNKNKNKFWMKKIKKKFQKM